MLDAFDIISEILEITAVRVPLLMTTVLTNTILEAGVLVTMQKCFLIHSF
jgi:hypothetical protein